MPTSVSHLHLVLLLSLLTSFAVEGARVKKSSRSSSFEHANVTDANKFKAMEACASVFAIEELTGSTGCRAEKMATDDVLKQLKKLGDDALTLPEGFTCGRGYECENSEGIVRNVLAGQGPSVCGGELTAFKTCVAIDERSYRQKLSQKVGNAWTGASNWLSSKSDSEQDQQELQELQDAFDAHEEPEEPGQPAAPQRVEGKTTSEMDTTAMCNAVFENAGSKCRTPQMRRSDVEKAIRPQKLAEGMTCRRGYECNGGKVVAGDSPAVCRGRSAKRVCIPLKLGGKTSFLKRILG